METLHTFLINFAFQEPNWDNIEKRRYKMRDDELRKSINTLKKRNRANSFVTTYDQGVRDALRIANELELKNRTSNKKDWIEVIEDWDDSYEYPNIDESDIPETVRQNTPKGKYIKKSPYWTKKKLGLLAGGVLGASAIGLGTKMYLDRRNKTKK